MATGSGQTYFCGGGLCQSACAGGARVDCVGRAGGYLPPCCDGACLCVCVCVPVCVCLFVCAGVRACDWSWIYVLLVLDLRFVGLGFTFCWSWGYVAACAPSCACVRMRALDTGTHDIGFIIFGSFGNGIQLGGMDAEYTDIVVQAGKGHALKF